MEPFGLGALLRLSPTRTKRVMRDLLGHGLLQIAVVQGDDGRNELRVTPTRETARWYARVLRSRAAIQRYPALSLIGAGNIRSSQQRRPRDTDAHAFEGRETG